ncbi:uncharacterized protein ColSpa_02696 [Colletotrichum spaethianum]|uniref:Uncharacterized protein n=1 Tax=Colletotrichum spaethianum TaxID=700344 RepID=A0AA37NXM5_9PEZI|nr:uncharacterized protein ColSpa_02696 [Colletotrichum spaethianum]GKT42515.1 hypothetical protein ColSpa_02696 [Colletotrichum spaethianum]
MEESSFSSYNIKKGVLKDWLKWKYPGNNVDVTVKDADFVVQAPEKLTAVFFLDYATGLNCNN